MDVADELVVAFAFRLVVGPVRPRVEASDLRKLLVQLPEVGELDPVVGDAGREQGSPFPPA